MQLTYPATLVAWYYVFSVLCFSSVYPCVRLSDMIPVSELPIPFNMSVALNLHFLCILGLPSKGSSNLRKTCPAPNITTLQHDSSIRTKIANV